MAVADGARYRSPWTMTRWRDEFKSDFPSWRQTQFGNVYHFYFGRENGIHGNDTHQKDIWLEALC